MIKQEEKNINGKTFILTYSDQNKYIRKVGTNEIYEKAEDISTTHFIYEETNDIIEVDDNIDE